MSQPNAQLRNFKAQVALTAAATAATVKAADDSASYIYVQRFGLSITTVANTKKTTMTDSASSPVTYATYTDLTETAANNKAGVIWFDFGRRGCKLTLGKNLTVTGEASGSAGWAFAEGYQSAS